MADLSSLLCRSGLVLSTLQLPALTWRLKHQISSSGNSVIERQPDKKALTLSHHCQVLWWLMLLFCQTDCFTDVHYSLDLYCLHLLQQLLRKDDDLFLAKVKLLSSVEQLSGGDRACQEDMHICVIFSDNVLMSSQLHMYCAHLCSSLCIAVGEVFRSNQTNEHMRAVICVQCKLCH